MKNAIVTICVFTILSSVYPLSAKVISIGKISVPESILTDMWIKDGSRRDVGTESFQQNSQQQSWFSKNWKWFVPVVVLGGGIVAMAGLSGGYSSGDSGTGSVNGY